MYVETNERLIHGYFTTGVQKIFFFLLPFYRALSLNLPVHYATALLLVIAKAS